MKTAVVLFVYKRPDHAEKVIKGLRENNIKELFVFADGPKNESDIKSVNETRKLITDIDWCKVIYDFKEKNIGLANSVISGITNVFSQGYDRVIVVEEDCIPKNGFIDFMEKAFDYYENIDEVMHISGFGLPIKKRTEADVYFTPYPCSWGWGTWKKYWEKCDFTQIENYKELLGNKEELKRFNYAGEGLSEFLERQVNGQVDSWLIRWYYHIFRSGGKCVWSYDSYIYNIGFDGSGKHRVKYDRFNQKISDKKRGDIIFTKDLRYNDKIIKEFRRYFMGKKISERLKTLFYTLWKIHMSRG